MTRRFDEAAAATEAGGFWPLATAATFYTPSELVVRPVSVRSIRGLVAAYHYSRRMPDAVQECFAGFYGDTFAGGVAFGPGAASVRRELPDLDIRDCRELVRLWSPDGLPRNTESRLVAVSLRLLRGVRLVIAFSDPEAGHIGTVYQATNAIYLGCGGRGNRYIDGEGRRLHSRLASVYRMRHPEYAGLSNAEVAALEGWQRETTSGKHRYAWAFSRDDRLALAALAQTYPKHAPAAPSGASDCQSEGGGSQPTPALHRLSTEATA
jgi:hypothetical protein